MKHLNFPQILFKNLLFIFGLLFSNLLFSQNSNADICNDSDCSSELFNIKLEEPFNPSTGFDAQRTERFKNAFADFQRIKATYINKDGWQGKYNASQIGGQSCLRHYQLESMFAHEYSTNADFKSWMDNNGNANADFLKSGFNSSRKGLNLKTRMQKNCSSEIKKVEEKAGPKLNNLDKEYMKLGQDLGYFDEQGNLLKPIEIPEEEKQQPQPKMNKKEQVEQLKQQVNVLPLGSDTENKINQIEQDLKNAQPKADKLGSFFKNLAPTAAALLAPQSPLAANLGKTKNMLGGLMDWKPKFPKSGLQDKIKGLFNRADKSKNKADDLVKNTEELKTDAENLDKKAQQVSDDLNKNLNDIAAAKDKLEDLRKLKEELVNKLNDKPKKILDELNKSVSDAEKKAKDLVQKAKDVEKAKDDLLKKLADLEKQRDKLTSKKDDLAQKTENLKKDENDIQKAANDLADQVEAAKKADDKLEDIQNKLANLLSDDQMEQVLNICEDDLKSLLSSLNPVKDAQQKINQQFDKVKDKPKGLFEKIKNLKLFQEKLKLPKINIPVAEKTLKKVDGLLQKANTLGKLSEALLGKKTNLQTQIEEMNSKLNAVQDAYQNQQQKLETLKGDLVNIVAEKSGLKQKFENAMLDVEDLEKSYDNFIKKYNIFNDESKCIDKDELEKKLEELQKEQSETEPKIEELEKEVADTEQKTDNLKTETDALAEEIEEEEKLREEFGKEIDLEPVTTEEWTESFEVKREFWDAVFHPDDEVVDGYKGRWFQVKLKDASKNVKLLFGPGEYFMSKGDFRDNYGSVIGAFVTEALNGMKKAERNEVKLFVQGSADITGQNTFRGKLDEGFLYQNVTVLPQKGETDNFENTPTDKDISPTNFTNDDLPDLRGRYLKEMISVYSKKLDPILLEGSVKKKENKEDRNAVIYLFIPETLVEKYED